MAVLVLVVVIALAAAARLSDDALVAAINLFNLLPQLLVIGFVVYVIHHNRERIGKMIETRWPDVTSLKASLTSFEINFALTEAAKEQSKGGVVVTVSPGASTQIDHRAARLKPLLRGARLLWVDDEPERNHPLQAVLEGWFEREVDIALTTDEALDRMRRQIYDAVVTDLKRKDYLHDAFRFFDGLPPVAHPPIVVYAGQLALCTATLEPSAKVPEPCTARPKFCTDRPQHNIAPGDRVLEINNVQLPCKAFAITVQPDELLNLIMDVLERQRWNLAAAA